MNYIEELEEIHGKLSSNQRPQNLKIPLRPNDMDFDSLLLVENILNQIREEVDKESYDDYSDEFLNSGFKPAVYQELNNVSNELLIKLRNLYDILKELTSD